jgi:hypothetical protein
VSADFEIDRTCLAKFHALELRLARMDQQMKDLEAHCHDIHAWRETDSAKSAWYYAVETELRELVEATRWAKTSRRVVGWSIGAAAGALLFWQQIGIWIREHMAK